MKTNHTTKSRGAPVPAAQTASDPCLPEVQPTVIVAPELVGRRDFAVVREPDDTDADYQARCDLLALLLDHAHKA
jgi:hypothetical protein